MQDILSIKILKSKKPFRFFKKEVSKVKIELNHETLIEKDISKEILGAEL